MIWEILYSKTDGQKHLLVNLQSSWQPPKVGDTWGPFVVTAAFDFEMHVTIRPISNFLTIGLGEPWSVFLRDPETGERKLLVEGLHDDYRLPNYGEVWGPFVVVGAGSISGEIVIEPINELLA